MFIRFTRKSKGSESLRSKFKALYHILEWRSEKNPLMCSASLLIKIWNQEEEKLGGTTSFLIYIYIVEHDQEDCTKISLDSLMGKNQSKRDFSSGSDLGRSITEISENFRVLVQVF